jgi:hypothetical protein
MKSAFPTGRPEPSDPRRAEAVIDIQKPAGVYATSLFASEEALLDAKRSTELSAALAFTALINSQIDVGVGCP